MKLDSLWFKKSTSPKHHIYYDDFWIRYNPIHDSWHVRGNWWNLVAFYPKSEEDILDARRLFTK